MENDEKTTNIIVDNNNSSFRKLEYFKADFVGQKVKKLKEFKKWNNEMKKKCDYLYYCSNDGVYFYELDDFHKITPYYNVKCPNCHSFICYFCSKKFNKLR